METVKQTLNNYGKLGVDTLKNAVQKVSATGSTAESIHYEVESKEGFDVLRILGRKYFKAIETGRGPRKGTEDQDFKSNMLDYMNARGIGTDLSPKKREELAKFLVLKINREGDQTYKKGGRIVYSPALTKLVVELKNALVKDAKLYLIKEIQTITKAA